MKKEKTVFSPEPRPARAGCLKVTERFLCFEGEGRTLGALTWLIRLSGCDLRCSWCDSKQSSFFDDEERMVPAAKLRAEALASGAAWVSVTGGEPTWRDSSELKTLAGLCAVLRKAGRKVKIESNGLRLPPELKDAADLWSLAPKWDARRDYAGQLSSAMRYDLSSLAAFQRAHGPQRLQLKFVVSAGPEGEPLPGDLRRVRAILSGLPRAGRPPVFLIPEAYGRGPYLKRCAALEHAGRGLAKGLKGWDLRVQPQWHRVLHGDERGY